MAWIHDESNDDPRYARNACATRSCRRWAGSFRVSAALGPQCQHAQGAQELLREVAEPTCCNAVATITC
jgi:hypothetical protein